MKQLGKWLWIWIFLKLCNEKLEQQRVVTSSSSSSSQSIKGLQWIEAIQANKQTRLLSMMVVFNHHWELAPWWSTWIREYPSNNYPQGYTLIRGGWVNEWVSESTRCCQANTWKHSFIPFENISKRSWPPARWWSFNWQDKLELWIPLFAIHSIKIINISNGSSSSSCLRWMLMSIQ